MIVTYLQKSEITAKRRTTTPRYNRSSAVLPTMWQIKMNDKRWRRVYVECGREAASPYIIFQCKKLFLGSYFLNRFGLTTDHNNLIGRLL